MGVEIGGALGAARAFGFEPLRFAYACSLGGGELGRIGAQRARLRFEGLTFGLRRFPSRFRFCGVRLGRLQFVARCREAVFVFETHGRWLRCVGAADETVPAPEIAFERYQASARRKLFRECCAIFGFDDADQRQARGELRWRLHKTRERLRARRQVWRWRVSAAPTRWRLVVCRCVDVVAKRCGERALVAGLDIDRSEHGWKLGGVGRRELVERAHFGVEFLQGFFRGAVRRPGGFVGSLGAL